MTPPRPQAPRAGSATAVRPASPPAPHVPRSTLLRLIAGVWARIEDRDQRSGNSSYYLILGSTIALTAVGLLMVLSSSAVEAIAEEGSSYALFLKQGMFGVAGLALMFILSRLPVRTIKLLAWPAVGVAVLLLIAIFTPLGYEVNGNRSWLRLGGLTAQPSEAAKFALCLWMPLILARKGPLLRQVRHALIPVLPVAGMIIVLVVLQHDLGTSLLLTLIVIATLFFAGVPKRLFLVAGVLAAAGAVVMALGSGNRMCRITGWLGDGQCVGINDQANAGLGALASGGWWGLGLGQSRQKWFYIPEAHNDFIFSIIGEELGLVGTIVVLCLFGILAIAILRVIMRHTDPFVRITSGAILTWILGQAFVNIAMVTGLLPVIGVPLPFISYGGSSLLVVLCGIGVVLSFARARPTPRRGTGGASRVSLLTGRDGRFEPDLAGPSGRGRG
ncbi:putative lipid II flippase FtsW [Tersicoccus sp. Bi-70]|uniref:putative lipid II flippase FtsW n=1 Tax=Tersicoccus sp. Bi-70 TaxID=1897634 RepID=UPI0009F9EDAE|nr:putative lipid II flippase FtsW [Tersicoccus sp. Bi-70]